MVELTTELVIGDPHAHPRWDNDRFEHLGKAARVYGVDYVHCVGDWTDWPSLSAHKTARELREALYERDMEAGNDALQRFDDGLDGHPCRKTITLGNHDMYPDRFVEENEPGFEGIISWRDVRFNQHGWVTYPFKTEATARGIVRSHYFVSGDSGRAQGGEHVAHHNAVKQGDSVLFGHNHRFDMKVRTFGPRRKIYSFSAGCMVHPRYNELWCRDTRCRWDRGILLLRFAGKKLMGFEWVDYRVVKGL